MLNAKTVEHQSRLQESVLDAAEGTRGNNCKASGLKRVQPPCVKQAAGSARREEPGGHTGKAQQVSSKVTANEQCA
jgi:hypothetical protein